MNIEVNKEAIQVPPPTTTENFYPPRLPQRSPGGIRFVIVSRGHGGRRRLNYGGVNDFPPLREGRWEVVVHGRTVGGRAWGEVVVEVAVFGALVPELQPWMELGHWPEVEGGQSPPSGASAGHSATAHSTHSARIGRERDGAASADRGSYVA